MSNIQANIFTGLYVGALFNLASSFCHFSPLFQINHMRANQQWAIRQEITQDVGQIKLYSRISLFITSSNVSPKAKTTREIVSFYFQWCIQVFFFCHILWTFCQSNTEYIFHCKCRRNRKPRVHVYLKLRHKIYTDLSTLSYTCILRRALFYSIITSPCELTVFIDLQMYINTAYNYLRFMSSYVI
jgi:hypothetical protein